MKVYEGKDIRNVGLVGHGHSGKTMLTSALLYTAGATNRLTRPDEGNTITDFDEEEISRKITVSSARAAAEWKKTKINLIDTPGFNIFIQDTRAAMVATDSVVLVVDGIAGVEVQTEKVFQFAEEFQLPCAFVRTGCFTPVASEATTTSASGTTAPCASVTRPPSVARDSCPSNIAGTNTAKKRNLDILTPRRLLR